MHLPPRLTALMALIALALVAAAPPAVKPRPDATKDDEARVDYFEKKVRPILVQHCYGCHSADTNSKGGLRVDDRKGLLVGGDSGPAVVPGKPKESLLLKRVTQKDDKRRTPRE